MVNVGYLRPIKQDRDKRISVCDKGTRISFQTLECLNSDLEIIGRDDSVTCLNKTFAYNIKENMEKVKLHWVNTTKYLGYYVY